MQQRSLINKGSTVLLPDLIITAFFSHKVEKISQFFDCNGITQFKVSIDRLGQIVGNRSEIILIIVKAGFTSAR